MKDKIKNRRIKEMNLSDLVAAILILAGLLIFIFNSIPDGAINTWNATGFVILMIGLTIIRFGPFRNKKVRVRKK